MKKILSFFIKDGQSTPIGGLFAILLAISAIALVVRLQLNNVFGWTIIVISGVVILVFGIAGKAEAIGLKPFTNDPLGWRKAKATYQDEESLPAKKPGFIARLFGRK